MSDHDETSQSSTLDTLQGPPGREDDRSESAIEVNRLGTTLVHYLFSASKTVQVHDLNNRATQRVMSELMETLEELFKIDTRISLRIAADFVVINEVRVAVDPQNYGPFLYIMEEMKKRDLEGIDFLQGISNDEAGVFLKLFFQEVSDEHTFDRLCQTLAQSDVTHVVLTQWVEREMHLRKSDEEAVNVREESNQVFFRTVALMGEVLKGIEQRRAIQVRKAERLTQQMVDIIQTDESILVGLASIKNFDEYTFTHSVNVCILSMLIGDRLRLYKSDIARLGVAALLHDIGKTYVPQTILNKPGKLNDQEWDLMKYHTFFGVKELSRVKSLREVADALFVALQHHVHLNMNGYPQKPSGWNLRLFSRIVTVADYYDAMTTPRIYKMEPLAPDQALRFILEKSGQIFDPFIAKVFIQAMGIYPIGTVVHLDSGEDGVVIKQNDKGRFIHRPMVALFESENGERRMGGAVDLTELASDGNTYARSIDKTYYSDEAEIKKGSSFIAE